MSDVLSRRRLLGTGALGAGGLLLGACDRLNASSTWRGLLGAAEPLNRGAQRLLMGNALAPEFTAADVSPRFRTNGNTRPASADWARYAASGFADWRLIVDGLVRRPLALPLSALQQMPQRAQITRHDCVEGWSAIGKWQGPPLRHVLSAAGLLPSARYIVFHCADDFAGVPFYESIDMADALHPQTILAWRMNDAPLPIGHGAPVRARIERQLGYKHAKFVMRIEARASLAGLYAGKGGYWEDVRGYEWYAGI